MGVARRIGFFARIGLHLAVAAAKVGVLFPRWSAQRRIAHTQSWSRTALTIFRCRIVVEGTPPPPGCARLIVANHVSWLDIYAIASQTDAVFVAKEEVRRWPMIGWLACRLGTIFVRRTRLSALPRHIGSMASCLSGGRSIGLFPEGTTTDGSTVLPFHAAYFEAAIVAAVPVQPVVIRYLRDDGSIAAECAFTGDASLVDSFRQLSAPQTRIVKITFLPAIDSTGRERRSLAAEAGGAIRGHLLPSRVTAVPARNEARTAA